VLFVGRHGRYGVNFVLGAGLHSYGFGGGGQIYVLSAVVLQALYVGVAALRRRRTVALGGSDASERPPVASPALRRAQTFDSGLESGPADRLRGGLHRA
jgi:hypothetical protein